MWKSWCAVITSTTFSRGKHEKTRKNTEKEEQQLLSFFQSKLGKHSLGVQSRESVCTCVRVCVWMCGNEPRTCLVKESEEKFATTNQINQATNKVLCFCRFWRCLDLAEKTHTKKKTTTTTTTRGAKQAHERKQERGKAKEKERKLGAGE